MYRGIAQASNFQSEHYGRYAMAVSTRACQPSIRAAQRQCARFVSLQSASGRIQRVEYSDFQIFNTPHAHLRSIAKVGARSKTSLR